MEERQVISCHTVQSWNEHIKKGIDNNKLIVVDFTASWCGPCRTINPFFSELAKKFGQVMFLKVDVDELNQVASEWGVEAMPTFVFVKDGKSVEKVVGARKDELQRVLDKHLAADAPA